MSDIQTQSEPLCTDSQAVTRNTVLFQNKKEQLKKWFALQKHLPQNAVDDFIFEKFISGTKDDLERAKQKLDAYFTVRNFCPQFFAYRSPLDSLIAATYDYLYMFMLPGYTDDGSRVLMVRLKHGDPENYNMIGIARRFFNIIDIWLKTDPKATRIYFIADCSLATKRHVLSNSPKKIKEGVYCIQRVYPVGIQEIYFFNVTKFVRTMIENILKPLVRKKLARKIFAYGEDHSEIYKKIPLSIMPSDYGGGASSMENLSQEWINRVNEHQDWLMTAGMAKSDESLREDKGSIFSGCTVI